jgi:hypothetical protein
MTDENDVKPRRRGRPAGLRKLLLERFPDGATRDQLREAGYDADPLQEIYLKPPFVDFDEQTGIYSIRRGNRGRPAMTEEQRAARHRERVLREAEQLGIKLAKSDVTEYPPDHEFEFHELCCDPLMTGDEFEAFCADIEERGQLEPITLHPDGRPLDGRNRIFANRRLGRPTKAITYQGDNPKAFVESINFHRRHLTTEQKRKRAARMLRDNTQHSDRAIARIAGLDKNTVADERAKQESRGEIPHVSTRTDTRGRQQPAHKPRPSGQTSDEAREAMRAHGHRMNESMRERAEPRQITYVPPAPEPLAPVTNQPIISSDLTRFSSAEWLATIPNRPDTGEPGTLSERPRIYGVPRDPVEMAAFLFDEIGAHDCRKLVDAILVLLRPDESLQ